MLKERRHALHSLKVLAWDTRIAGVHAQTAGDIAKLINRLLEQDSIDLAKDVKFREGLEPALHAPDADDSAMRALRIPMRYSAKTSRARRDGIASPSRCRSDIFRRGQQRNLLDACVISEQNE